VAFRIVRKGKDDGNFKNLDFEAPVAIASMLNNNTGTI